MSTGVVCPACGRSNSEFNVRCERCGGALADAIGSTTSLDAVAAADPMVGASFAGYAIKKRIGAGGMGVVYEAFDAKLGRKVAVKVLSPDGEASEVGRQRFLREARTIAALDHPNVGTVYEIGEHEGRPFLVMALYSGGTLATRLANGRLGLPDALALLQALLAGLGAAHAAGILHRDIKPANLLFTASGELKIGDFGLAKSVEKEVAESTLTSSGQVLGTVSYMAPEQFRGAATDARTDLWAVGVVAYEMLTGKLPFGGNGGPAATMQRVLNEAPPPLPEEVPEALAQWVLKALEKPIEKRHASAEQAATELHGATLSVGQDATVPSLRATTRSGSRPRRAAWLGSAAALSVIAAAISVASRRSPPAATEQAIADPAPLATASSVLACPILEAKGVVGHGGWLGATAAHLACQRVEILFGGRIARTLVPAELLSLPTEPVATFPDDPYLGPSARAASIAAASRANAYLDGSVTRRDREFDVELSLKTPAGATVKSAHATARSVYRAVAESVDALVDASAIPRAPDLDDDVKAWTGFRSIDAMLLADDLDQSEPSERPARCERAGALQRELGPNWAFVRLLCASAVTLHAAEPGSNSSDSPTPGERARTGCAEAGEHPERAKAIAADLAKLVEGETSKLGQATLALAEACAWSKAGDRDAARAALVTAVRRYPRLEGWVWLARDPGAAGGSEGFFRGSAAWEPYDLSFVFASPMDRAMKLRYVRRAFELGTNVDFDSASTYLELLLAAGQREEAIALAASYSAVSPDEASLRKHFEAVIVRSEGRFAEALRRENEIVQAATGGYDDAPVFELLDLATLLGREEEVADAWTKRFLFADPPKLDKRKGGEVTAIAMCMQGSSAWGARCLARVADVYRAERPGWSDDSSALFDGAIRYVKHDQRGAVEAWRPVLRAGLAWRRALPVGAFDDAGEPEIAEQLDGDRADDAAWRGITLALPRAAIRAAKRGDGPRARELATKVIDAWIDADVAIPILKTMQRIRDAKAATIASARQAP